VIRGKHLHEIIIKVAQYAGFEHEVPDTGEEEDQADEDDNSSQDW